MWMWVAALLGTLVAFAAAWRSLNRADVALTRVHVELGAVDGVVEARDGLDHATRVAAGERVRLHTRAADR